MTAEDDLAKAEAAEKALLHLGPAFDVVMGDYRARLDEVMETEPWAADRIRSLALAFKIARAVREHIEAVASGKVAAMTSIDRRRQIEEMSPERRRLLSTFGAPWS